MATLRSAFTQLCLSGDTFVSAVFAECSAVFNGGGGRDDGTQNLSMVEVGTTVVL
jgi:hypothetical protein